MVAVGSPRGRGNGIGSEAQSIAFILDAFATPIFAFVRMDCVDCMEYVAPS